MTWQRSPEVVWRCAPGYLVMAGIDGHITEVGGPGRDVWDRLVEPTGEPELIAELAGAYATEPASIANDVHTLLITLQRAGCVHSG